MEEKLRKVKYIENVEALRKIVKENRLEIDMKDYDKLLASREIVSVPIYLKSGYEIAINPFHKVTLQTYKELEKDEDSGILFSCYLTLRYKDLCAILENQLTSSFTSLFS